MCKRLCLLASFVLLLVGAPVLANPVGVFDFSQDVGTPGDPWAIGSTLAVGNGEYIVTAGGSDIWGNADHFHYAYNQVEGNVRFSLHPEWHLGNQNDWAKIGAMIRVSNDADSVQYSTATRRGGGDAKEQSAVGPYVGMQARSATGAGSYNVAEIWDYAVPDKVAIQRITSGAYQVVQALVDFGGGSGWENVGIQYVPDLPDRVLLGAAVTSHKNNNNQIAQARLTDVLYDYDPGLIGSTQIPGDQVNPDTCIGDTPGFLVKVAQNPDGTSWPGDYAANYEMAEYLVKNGGYGVDPDKVLPKQMGSGSREFINLHDSGGRFNFDNDASFPGIDGWEKPTNDPADGDGEDQFAAVITACIELTEGLHVIGGHADDGILVRIGGVEIGRTATWNTTDDWMFEVETAGIYDLEAIMFEGGGGADAELTYVLPTGERILLGDVAAGSPAVYVPEPATIALLGFGGLSLLRIRRKR